MRRSSRRRRSASLPNAAKTRSTAPAPGAVTVRNVESLFQSVLEQSGWENGCSIRVVQDDSLRPEAVEESAA